MRYRKTIVFSTVLMLGAFLVLWQLASAKPPLKPGNPGLPGCLAEVDELTELVEQLQSQPPSPVPQTGQTTSYAVGDDGDLEKGIVCPDPRFTDKWDGTVTDNCTGLVWLKNANCFGGLETWTDALNDCSNLTDGDCGLTDGSVAGEWRLPNIRELRSLIDYRRRVDPTFDRTLPFGHPFSNVSGYHYWSSTTTPSAITQVLTVSFGTGRGFSNGKISTDYVWCVRDGN